MMHGCGKSDFAIVAEKPANKAEQSAAESVEPRAETKGNANQQSTHRTQSRVCTENLIRIDCVTESPNVNGDDRALLPLPDPVRLAVQVEEPT